MVSASPPHTRITPDVPLTFAARRLSPTRPVSYRGPRIILIVIASVSLVGTIFALWLRSVPAGNPDPRLWFNVFFLLFARNEPVGLLIVALFGLLGAFLIFRKAPMPEKPDTEITRAPSITVGVAVLVLVITALGTQIAFHNYALTADEYLADFQAGIFARGKFQAEIPSSLVDAVRVISPIYIEYFPATHSWNTPYLPVYAAMRALFRLVDLAPLLNPVLAAVTILALYGTARNIWPDTKTNAVVPIILLAGSAQFLVMSMTAYSMPAHLALNTIWLWLYSQPNRRLFYLAPVIGVVALGLHQPFFHALFAAPFLLRLGLQRKWKATLIFAAIYLVGCAGWIFWWTHFRAHFGTSSATTVFRWFNPRMGIIQPMNLLLIIGWSCLATPLLAVLGASRFFQLPAILQDAAMSCLLTFVFYCFFYLDQAHGWGYRYFHGVLSCLVLIAVAGWIHLSKIAGRPRAIAFLGIGAVISLFVQLPLRCLQAEAFVRPFARASAVLHAIPKDVVAFDPRSAWYSADLIRNDPFLENRPLIVSIYRLDPKAIAALQKAGSVQFVDEKMLARLGMSTVRRNDYKHDPFQLGAGK